ncbi:hypothetical protein BDF22DRAFT_665602 [Syncephalis plumigaleata]|nr:hypothetical protein BDF22DRAFT_665602 [Syncephalis plumigaleata]
MHLLLYHSFPSSACMPLLRHVFICIFVCLLPSTYSIYLQAYTASSNKLAYMFMHPSLLIPCSFVTSQSFY